MQSYSKEQAIRRMNQLSREGKPFLFIINYLQDCSYIEEIADIDSSDVLYDLNGYTNIATTVPAGNDTVKWEIHPVSLACYQQAFESVRGNILAGNSFLTNLTCRTPIRTNLSLKEIFLRSKAMYRLWVKDTFVVFSPEIFVRIHNGRIRSFPMKGTIDASLPAAGDTLMNDAKEMAEHATIVDLIRNDLSMVAKEVAVSRYRYMEEVHTNDGGILQTSSEISGVLPDCYKDNLGDILFKLLPAGSITGAPKYKTMEIIAQSEGYDRGFYSGITGYFDGENLDSAVMIRYIEEKDGQLYFKSGGGITCRSVMESEYNEMKQKIYVPIY